MHHRKRARALSWSILLVVAAALAIGACGTSSDDPGKLLSQTFSGPHKVNSGTLNLALTIDPAGSSILTSPITISFGGPFQSLGSGKLPQSNFSVTLSALSRTVSLGILSTGTAGYVTLQGISYQMPQATFQRLESSFAQLASSPSSSGSGALGRLGIQPLHWLTDPTVVGDENIAGDDTTHIRAGVNVRALLNDLNTFLERASSLGVSGVSSLRSGIPPATRDRIANEIKHPSFDVWTGKSDKTIRKLVIGLTLPVTGQLSSELGGLRSADIGLTMQYANLNKPQTIKAPATVRPFSEFAAKLRAFFQGLQSLTGSVLGTGSGSGSSGAAGGGSSGSTGGGSSGSSGGGSSGSSGGGSSGAAAGVQRYSQCIQAAGNDVAKMQQCASLLNGG